MMPVCTVGLPCWVVQFSVSAWSGRKIVKRCKRPNQASVEAKMETRGKRKNRMKSEQNRDRNTLKAIIFLSLGLLLKRHLTPRNVGMSADVFLIR